MAYCRFDAKSDLYLYHHIDGYWECCACRLTKKTGNPPWYRSVRFTSLQAVWAHFADHIAHGHEVPPRALKRVAQEVRKQGDQARQCKRRKKR
jgi:hypothetical protein